MGAPLLADAYPKLAKEWSPKNGPIRPDNVTCGSQRKVLWKGTCGHEWAATVKNRTSCKSGCPYCSSRAVLPGFNDLQTLHPDIAAEWSPRNGTLTPRDVMAFANRRAWWKCSVCGNEWYALISTRSDGSGCPFCSGARVGKGLNDLLSCYPAIAADWSPKNKTSPDQVSAKSVENVWWRCSCCGYEWKAVIASRARGQQCPVCSNRTAKPGINDFGTTDPALLLEWNYKKNKSDPKTILRTSSKPVWWSCAFGHHWSMSVRDRAIKKKGCIYCEQDFAESIFQLAGALYARRRKLKVICGSDDLIGLPLEVYYPELSLAVDVTTLRGKTHQTEQHMKRLLCRKRKIDLYEIDIERSDDSRKRLHLLRECLKEAGISICSDEEDDLRNLRKQFDVMRSRIAAQTRS